MKSTLTHAPVWGRALKQTGRTEVATTRIPSDDPLPREEIKHVVRQNQLGSRRWGKPGNPPPCPQSIRSPAHYVQILSFRRGEGLSKEEITEPKSYATHLGSLLDEQKLAFNLKASAAGHGPNKEHKRPCSVEIHKTTPTPASRLAGWRHPSPQQQST